MLIITPPINRSYIVRLSLILPLHIYIYIYMQMRSAVREVATHFPTAIITGRSRDKVTTN